MAIYKEDIVDIELESGNIHRTFLHHSIGLGDAKANRFGVRLFRNGEPEAIGAATLTALFMAPNGQNQIINETNFSGSTSISGNVAYVTLPSACYANEGQFCLAIKLNISGVTTTMRIIDGMVDNTGVTGATVPATPVPTSDQILAAYDAAVAMAASSVRFDTAQALETSEKKQARMNIDAAGNGIIAEPYDGNATYAAGDYVIWNGELRRSQVDGNTGHEPGSSTTTYWAVCTAMGQVKTVLEDVAAPWVANHDYQVGDYVSRNRKILRMTVQPTTPDATWNDSHWTEVDDVANDLENRLAAEATTRAEAVSAEATARAAADSEVKSALNQNMILLDDPELSDPTWITGKYVNASTNAITAAGNTLHITDYIYLPSSTYKIRTNAKYWSSAWTIAFYNSSKQFISGAQSSLAGYKEFTTIPSGAEYAIITHLSDSYATSTVTIEVFANKRIDDAETDISLLQKYADGIDNKSIDISITWTASKRLDVNGEIVNATSSFAISQPIEITDDQFYKFVATGLYGISDGSTVSIQDGAGNVLYRAAQNGRAEFVRASLPSGYKILYLCQYITTGHALTDVTLKKYYSKRIIDIENDIDSLEGDIDSLESGIDLDTNYENILQGATTFTDNKFVDNLGNTVTNNNFCLIDGYYPIKPSTTYKLYRGEPSLYSVGGHNWTWWDKDKAFVGYQISGSAVTSPENAAFLRFGIYISNTGSATHENFDPTNVIITEDANPCFENVFASSVSRPTFAGKKWIGVGDSITEDNFRATYHYWSYIQAETGLNFVNMGVSGTGYKAEGSGDKAFYKRVPNMATDADLITIFGGVNDIVLSNATIGTASDTGTDTICGCVNETIDEIEELYPAHMPIGIISPLPCYCTDTSVNLHPYQRPDDTTCRMSQFVEQLTIICNRRGIPFLDLFHQSNLRPWHSECNAKYFSCDSAPNGDGLHPNGYGHRLFYRQIMQFVEKLAMN